MSATISTNCTTYTVASSPPPTKMFLLGRATFPYAIDTAPPLGVDGSCDEKWNGSTWSLTNVSDSGIVWSTLLGATCYDSVSGLIYSFNNWDFTGNSWVYNTATDDYTAITSTPSTIGGAASFACCYSGNCFIFGGGIADGQPGGTYSFSNKIATYPINTGALSQSYTITSAVLPFSAKDIFGCVDPANPNLVYLGGGSTDINDPPTNSTAITNWVRYDLSSPNTNPVAMTSMPTGTAMAACCCLNGVIYVIGGCVNGTPNTAGTNTVRTYTIATNTWSTTTNFPINVASARATVFNGIIYCAGGWDQNGFATFDDPPKASSTVYKSSDAGVSWQIHSTLSDVTITSGTYTGTSKGAKASGGSILVAM